MDLICLIRFGYVLVIGTFLLMIWLSLSGAREIDSVQCPPCYFNQLCTCSKFVPDLGIVKCQDVHLPRIPYAINNSKVFTLHLENNGLRTIDPFFFQSTGLYKIVIRENPLYFIPDEAFMGLERSLWELDLSYNHLTYVPNRSLRYLQKLRKLDLSGNDIARISPDNWRGLENSLEVLILAENSITYLPVDSFSGLPMVETIDLRGNNLREIDPAVFRDGMEKLANLLLADNQLTAIPYQALSPLRMLKTLDLSHNRISNLEPAQEIGVQNINLNFLLSLDLLRLDYNNIKFLEPLSFQYFDVLNKTYLNGNPLSSIEEDAFRQAKIRELYLRDCRLTEIIPEAFNGLENYLEILDLSGNNISRFPAEAFNRCLLLKSLRLRDNLVDELNPVETFSGVQFTLYEMDFTGMSHIPVDLQDFRRLRNLRVLSLSRLTQSSIGPEDFAEYGIDLEELSITTSNLQTIRNNAFQSIHSLRMIDFSENSIGNIEKDAFADIGHSLLILKLSHALSSTMQQFPDDAIQMLTNLEELDMSNNKISILPETSFHMLMNLRSVELQDNLIDAIPKGTFQGDIHTHLEDIYFSFNSIKTIQQHTFVDLNLLRQLHLDDNQIETLERRSFMNLPLLKRLNLKGNKLTTLPYETFQNLPQLEDLDMSYNKLTDFNFGIFDQVGTLSTCRVNISHNELDRLVISTATTFESELGGGFHSNVKVLDLSYNNISLIGKQFFRPAEISLTHLYLSHNKLMNATKDVYGNMPHLQLVDLSHNSLYEMDFDTFRNTKSLQVLLASHNNLADIPNDLFRMLFYIRIVDFSHNRLRSLPDNLFREEGLERLDLSHNLIGRLPLNSMAVAAANTLVELDVSWNSISSLAHGGLFSRFPNLAVLDLSYNRLAQIDAGTFKGLPRLTSLKLGHNIQLTLEQNGLTFQGLEYSLLHLYLDNTSLTHVPHLPTPHLVTLSLSYNSLPTVAPELAGNLSSIQTLNLDYNDLTAIPIVTHSLPELRYLSMRANPITFLSNTSLLGVADRLKELDLRDLDLNIFETGTFCKMHSLRTLKIGYFRRLRNFNLPRILHFNSGLRNLEIHVGDPTENDMFDVMSGDLPKKVRNITFSGTGLSELSPYVLQGVRSPSLHFNLRNTSLTELPSSIFENARWVRNFTLDVRENEKLQSLGNPSTGIKPGLPRDAFLIDIKMSGSAWSCDCNLGWVEVWLRKERQYLCDHVSKVSSFNEIEYRCRHADDDLRDTLCSNKNNQSLIEVLKTDIECGWTSSTSSSNLTHALFLLVLINSIF